MNIPERARAFLRMEADAVLAVEAVLDGRFEQALGLLHQCTGRVVTTGMGKAGLIARKIASTLASTGTPSLFLHPAEAIHGDLGMVTGQDVVVAFSHKGQTEEVLRVIPYFKHVGAPLIAVTSNQESELARHADVALVIPIEREACPLNLAPTSSTTAMLALGDTLALTLLEARGFSQEDFALFHPGGSLGRRLLTKVGDIMHQGPDNPVVPPAMPLREAISVMNKGKLASINIIAEDGTLLGYYSNGDLMRYLAQGEQDLTVPVESLMTRNPKTASPDMMAVKALEILRKHKIITLPVVDDANRSVGMVHLHDITRAGIT